MEDHQGPAVDPTGDWLVESIGDEAVSPDASREVRFETGILSGRVGVNRFTGPYQIEEDVLMVAHIATTMMAGPPERMDLERRFTSALDGEHRLAMDGGALLIGTGEESIRLSRAPGDIVMGTVTYRERMMMPPGTVVTLEVIDVSGGESMGEPLAEQVIAPSTGPPIPFSLAAPVLAEDAVPALTARIVSDQGDLLWVTDSPMVIALDGEPVELLVRRPG